MALQFHVSSVQTFLYSVQHFELSTKHKRKLKRGKSLILYFLGSMSTLIQSMIKTS